VKALLLWMTGSPDRAVTQVARALEVASELDHPYSTCYCRFHCGLLDLWREDLDTLASHTDELLTVADAHDYPIWKALGLVLRGTVRVRRGATEEGLVDVDRGFELYQELSTPPVFWPALLMIRAAVCATAGQVQDARVFSDAVEAAIRDDPSHPLAVSLALARGDLLLALDSPDTTAAETQFELAAALAHERGARTIELQAATRLADLRRDGPHSASARERLRAVLDTFTEGLVTPQVVAARAALET
jgi:hypothetical protein